MPCENAVGDLCLWNVPVAASESESESEPVKIKVSPHMFALKNRWEYFEHIDFDLAHFLRFGFLTERFNQGGSGGVVVEASLDLLSEDDCCQFQMDDVGS
jgi:hypothetical protein